MTLVLVAVTGTFATLAARRMDLAGALTGMRLDRQHQTQALKSALYLAESLVANNILIVDNTGSASAPVSAPVVTNNATAISQAWTFTPKSGSTPASVTIKICSPISLSAADEAALFGNGGSPPVSPSIAACTAAAGTFIPVTVAFTSVFAGTVSASASIGNGFVSRITYALHLNAQLKGGHWIWMGGSNVVGQTGVYGTQGVAAAANVPGARESGVSWTDSANNFWLFGGDNGTQLSPVTSMLHCRNDLWKFDGTTWTWVSGSNALDQAGVYGAQGVASPANIPGARYGAASWIDNAEQPLAIRRTWLRF